MRQHKREKKTKVAEGTTTFVLNMKSIIVTRNHDTLNRSTGFSVDDASSFVVQHAYDVQGRLSSITSSVSSVTSVVNYTSDAATGLPTGHSVNAGGSGTLTVSKTHDGLNRLQSVDNTVEIDPGGMSPPTTTSISQYTYTHNNLGQRTSMEMDFGDQALDSTWHYEYDSLGQLENAWKSADGAVVPGRQYGYQFDDIGNRVKTTRGNNVSDLLLNPTPTVTSTYTPNLLNQYSQRTVPAYAEISGTANEDAILSFLNENTAARIRAGRNGEWFHTFMPLSNNSSSAVTNSICMTGVLPGQGTAGVDLINTNQTFTLSAMKTPEQFTYDDDGNMLSDGRFSYSWNGENRLVAVSNGTTEVAGYKYDHQGRRVSKTVGGITTTFIWDGNHIVYENSGSVTDVYTWGNDGHLITASLNGTNVLYAHDGNKNVTELVDNSGNIVAHYEFDPFGNALVKTGTLANENPFRFSTEYYDSETEFVAYQQRYLNTETGCWLRRDPAGEAGGQGLYRYVNNDPVLYVDYLGMALDDWAGPDGQIGVPYASDIAKLRSIIKHINTIEDIKGRRCYDVKVIDATLSNIRGSLSSKDVNLVSLFGHGLPTGRWDGTKLVSYPNDHRYSIERVTGRGAEFPPEFMNRDVSSWDLFAAKLFGDPSEWRIESIRKYEDDYLKDGDAYELGELGETYCTIWGCFAERNPTSGVGSRKDMLDYINWLEARFGEKKCCDKIEKAHLFFGPNP